MSNENKGASKGGQSGKGQSGKGQSGQDQSGQGQSGQSSSEKPPNRPSTTGNPSGGGRGNNPPKK